MRAVVLFLIIIIALKCDDDDDDAPTCTNAKGEKVENGTKWIDRGYVKQCIHIENEKQSGTATIIVACLSRYYQEIPINTEMTVRGKKFKCEKNGNITSLVEVH
ncbi:hypothetical protein Y032_0980g3276 [Ancylostoma ceylanicum]|uniref:Abnormal cell migration protein 18-like fibronectin type I domain-containing protein n=1 Tax=Ancylostoma ceylanicum TaxID=53326 RepID=A0A016W930_9BILA|nr:hypothetical protein Y032_0980g3276 [Ancylostoma ceylanicum]